VERDTYDYSVKEMTGGENLLGNNLKKGEFLNSKNGSKFSSKFFSKNGSKFSTKGNN